jgi:hypothetical protein
MHTSDERIDRDFGGIPGHSIDARRRLRRRDTKYGAAASPHSASQVFGVE